MITSLLVNLFVKACILQSPIHVPSQHRIRAFTYSNF